MSKQKQFKKLYHTGILLGQLGEVLMGYGFVLYRGFYWLKFFDGLEGGLNKFEKDFERF